MGRVSVSDATLKRREQILQESLMAARLNVQELSSKLGVSTVTIRRDLQELDRAGLLRRVHGGATAAFLEVAAFDPFSTRATEAHREKQVIGWLAAQLAQPGDTIMLDTGTTTLHVARHLAQKNGLTVITNTLPIAEELARNVRNKTILLGGALRPTEMSCSGPTVINQLARLSADKFFLSAAGFTLQKGAMDPDLIDAEIKQAMMASSREIILVADSRKWNVVKLAQVAPLDAIHKLVTDDALPAKAIEAIEATGVEVITPQRSSFENLLGRAAEAAEDRRG